VIHFYHLHALDWVDIVSALSADPAATSDLAQSISDWPLSSTNYFTGVRNRIQEFVDRGQLGPFGNAYWGHEAYKLPPEANLMAVAHYLEALEWQRNFIRIHAILGGKNPHLQSFLVGGMATPVDPDKQASINMTTIAAMQTMIKEAKEFVAKVYIPDLLAVASFYKDWAGYGAGVGNYLVYGEYPEGNGADAPLFLPSGVIRNQDLGNIEDLDTSKITEFVTHSWYDYEGGDAQGRPPRHRRQVQLAQVAALRRPADGSRSAVSHAGGLRPRQQTRRRTRRRSARQARGRTSGAVLDPRAGGGARHRDAGAGREARRLAR
jgi:[NiFe] hydrogenase large subunit/hydrogenase large subunit